MTRYIPVVLPGVVFRKGGIAQRAGVRVDAPIPRSLGTFVQRELKKAGSGATVDPLTRPRGPLLAAVAKRGMRAAKGRRWLSDRGEGRRRGCVFGGPSWGRQCHFCQDWYPTRACDTLAGVTRIADWHGPAHA